MSHLLALDQSTSATKALLVDATGDVVDRESREHRQFYPQPGWVEHDAEEIYRNAVTVLSAIADRAAGHARQIVGLSITNQRETIVVFDRATGAPLRPAIVWQCRRGDALCAEHAAAGHAGLMHRKTGLTLDAYFSASKIQWLMQHEPTVAARLREGTAVVGTIDSYLAARLTQGRVIATDTTNASRTLLFDLTRQTWDAELCDLWQVPLNALPEVRDSTARFGETTLNGAWSRAVPICGVMGDSQAALFAQRCFAKGACKATFGTGTSILLNLGPTPRFPASGVVTALAWTHEGKPTYALEGIIISSAATLAWLRDQLGVIRDFDELEPLARGVADNGGVYFVPAFSGLGLPHWRADARAAITGLTALSDRRHIVRAALEAIAYQLRDALRALQAEAQAPVTEIYCDGGGTANAWLMQFTADITGCVLRVSRMSDASALGAACAGQCGLGLVSSIEALASRPRDETVYQPAMPLDQVKRLCDGWQRAVQQVLVNPPVP